MNTLGVENLTARRFESLPIVGALSRLTLRDRITENPCASPQPGSFGAIEYQKKRSRTTNNILVGGVRGAAGTGMEPAL